MRADQTEEQEISVDFHNESVKGPHNSSVPPTGYRDIPTVQSVPITTPELTMMRSALHLGTAERPSLSPKT